MALDATYGSNTLYKAAAKLKVVEYIVDGRKWWRLPEPPLIPYV